MKDVNCHSISGQPARSSVMTCLHLATDAWPAASSISESYKQCCLLRSLPCCSKFETGYDDPRLGAMFVDRWAAAVSVSLVLAPGRVSLSPKFSWF